MLIINFSAKNMVYEIMYKDEEGGDTIVDEVSEKKLAYAANCPIIIDCNGSAIEGTILLCEQSPLDASKFLYTVMIPMEGCQARYEFGIEADRIKYRKAKTVNANDGTSRRPESPTEVSVVQNESIEDVAAEKKPSAALESPPGIEQPGGVPLSITCDSVANNVNKEGGGSVSSGRKRTSDVPPDLCSPHLNTKNLRVDTSVNNTRHNEQNKLDSGRSFASQSVASSRGANNDYWYDNRSIEMKIPQWIQQTRGMQRNLFCKLLCTPHSLSPGYAFKLCTSHNCLLLLSKQSTSLDQKIQPEPGKGLLMI